VAWVLEELGVPHELDFIQGDILGSLLALERHHEMRMAPIVSDGDLVMGFLVRMAERPAFQRAMKSTMPKGPPAM
jgi:hypothetical protein